MSSLDYQPMLDGVPVDPEPTGGSVDSLALFDNRARSGTPITIGAAVRVRAAVYRFTISDTSVDAGRYYARVTWTRPDAGQVVDDLPAPIDLPVRDDLVVSPEELAVRKLKLPLPLDEETREILAEAILEAQDDVVAYLGRPILPQVVTEQRTWPVGGAIEPLSHQPVHEILSEVEHLDGLGNPTGYWLITYRGGLDARSDAELRPIRRVVLAQAARSDAAVALWTAQGSGTASDGTGARVVRSVAAEGQSISYDYARPGDAGSTGGSADAGIVGGPVRWSAIDSWRLRGRRVFQRSGGQGGLTSLTIGL